jgi:D-lyxose ketol-isomerase
VLPPWAADAALPDVDVHSGKYDDTFSDYDPWQDSRRHSAWRCVHLQVGDWVFMPRGWWHVVRATVGSVMVNVRV